MQPTAETLLEGDMYKNVLIALNDSQAAERALHRAIAMAEIEKGDLFVVVVNEGVPEGNQSIAFWKPFIRYKQTSLSSGSLRTSGLEA